MGSQEGGEVPGSVLLQSSPPLPTKGLITAALSLHCSALAATACAVPLPLLPQSSDPSPYHGCPVPEAASVAMH